MRDRDYAFEPSNIKIVHIKNIQSKLTIIADINLLQFSRYICFKCSLILPAYNFKYPE